MTNASADELNRAFLKYYNTPDILGKVKIEPLQDLINKASSGHAKSPITITIMLLLDKNPRMKIRRIKPIVNIQDKRKEIAKKQYANEKNKEEHEAKVRQHAKEPTVYCKRYIRELKSGIMDILSVKPETLAKYNIQVVNGKYE